VSPLWGLPYGSGTDTNAQTITLPATIVQGAVNIVVKGETETNIVLNGNFANGDSWAPTAGAESVASNTYTLTGDGSQAYAYLGQDTNTAVVVGAQIYVRCSARVTNANCTSIKILIDGSTAGTETVLATQLTPTANTWYTVSGILATPADFTGNYRINIYEYYADAATQNGKVLEVKSVIGINLTGKFGAGSEPVAATCDLRYNHWFDGIKSSGAAGLMIRTKDSGGSVQSVGYVASSTYGLTSVGSVQDQVSITDGEKTQKNSGVFNLDGSYAWAFDTDTTGFKRVKTPAFTNYTNYTANCWKYDGKPLINQGSQGQISASTADRFLLWSDGRVYVDIGDSDSGWLEAWVPGTSFTGMTWTGLIQAYFYGWKLTTANTNVASCVWTGITSGTVKNAGAGDYAFVIANQDVGFTPYKLNYQLSVPVKTLVSKYDMQGFQSGTIEVLLTDGSTLDSNTTTPTIEYKTLV